MQYQHRERASELFVASTSKNNDTGFLYLIFMVAALVLVLAAFLLRLPEAVTLTADQITLMPSWGP
jgi:hypothetical protein